MESSFSAMPIMHCLVYSLSKPERFFNWSPEIEVVFAGIQSYNNQHFKNWKCYFSDSNEICPITNNVIISTYCFYKNNQQAQSKNRFNHWSPPHETTTITVEKFSIQFRLTLQNSDGKIAEIELIQEPRYNQQINNQSLYYYENY